MILTAKQEAGLKIAVDRYNAHEAYTCIAGYAGTGKSSLVSCIIAALNLAPAYVAYIAYTGKAALVLKNKGCPNATTAHKLLYNSMPRKDGTFYHQPKRPLDGPYKLIVVDEVSMIPRPMWELLLSHHIHVIALGDPGQLPPVGDENTDILKQPHIFLDEIMRQEADSEIVNMSMLVRQGKELPLFKGNQVQVLPRSEYFADMLTWADQVLVGKNATRVQINHVMRKMLLGQEDNFPVDGDKIICLKNDWNLLTPGGEPLVNGLIGTIKNPLRKSMAFVGNEVFADFVPDGAENQNDIFHDLAMDYKLFMNGEPTINKDNFRKIPSVFHPHLFDYGYCITCWKAQGSEYNKVLLFEEDFPRLGSEDHFRYLYTGITRAVEKLVIIKSR